MPRCRMTPTPTTAPDMRGRRSSWSMLSPRATARDMAQIWEKAKLKEDTDTDHSSEHAQEEDAVEEVVTGYHSLGYMVLLGFRSLQC